MDSLVLPKIDIHQRFRFRFIEIGDKRDHEDHYETKSTSWDFQGSIWIDVRRVKIEARRNSTALKRQLKEREQEAAGIRQKMNELYDKIAERQSQFVARLLADIDEDQRKVDSKKRKLERMMEKQAQLQAEKRLRDPHGG
jgi:hypothetical protein